MIAFEARNPFPLVDSFSKNQAYLHSREVDRWLGLNVESVELSLSKTGSRKPAPRASGEKQNLWFGLAPDDLQTPYFEIRKCLEEIAPQPGETVVDLGAGYGRMGFVLARHFPLCRFIGYEYVGERVEAGAKALEKFSAENASLIHADLANKTFQLEPAQYYFLYDFGTDSSIEKVLFDLKKISLKTPISVIARGRRCRYAIERSHPWLRASEQSSATAISIYRSHPSKLFDMGIEPAV